MRRDWLKAVGDNDFVQREEEKEVRQELVKRVKLAVKEACFSLSTSQDGELSFGETLKMVAVVESLLAWGLKAGSSYWQFAKEGLKNVENVPLVREVITQVERSGAEKTDLGRGRWFLILALRSKVLAFCVHTLQENSMCCARFYDVCSLWTNHSDDGVASTAALLVALNGIDFAAGPLLASLDERGTLVNVLEEVRGGKQETSSWGPFGFMKPKVKKKKKKKTVADLATPEKAPLAQEPAVEVAPQLDSDNPTPVMRHLEQIMGECTPPTARAPLQLSAAALFFEDQEPEAQVLAAPDSSGEEEARQPSSEGVVARAEPVFLLARDEGAREEEVHEDEKDVLHAQSVSPARSGFLLDSVMMTAAERGAASSTGWKTGEEDLLSGALFVPEPALSGRPKVGARAELLSLFDAEQEQQKEQQQEQHDHHHQQQSVAGKGVVVVDKEETEPEEMSEFEMQLERLEEERKVLERGLQQASVVSDPLHKEEKIVIREQPRMIDVSRPREIVVVADAGDLFGLAMSLTHPTESKKKKKKKIKTIVVRQLSTERAEPGVPVVSVRQMPLNLLSAPGVMSLEAQHHVCADCLRVIESGTPARLCNLFGRYFCFRCHVNDESLLPGRLLRLWDVKKYKVCVFAKQEISKSAKVVLYDIDYINSVLFKVCEPLMIARNLRRQLMLLVSFVSSCGFAEQLGAVERAGMLAHLAEESGTFSLHDLGLVLSGRLAVVLRDISLVYLQHVAHCPHCAARRVPCISCKALLFDFDVRNVSKCSRCGLNAHRACLKKGLCATCSRKR